MIRNLCIALALTSLTTIAQAQYTNFTPIDYPGVASATTVTGMNNAGTLVGKINGASGPGFVWNTGVFASVQFGGFATGVNGISNSGVAVGEFLDTSGPQSVRRGFVRQTDGSLSALPDSPAAYRNINPLGINTSGLIVGSWNDVDTTPRRAFRFDGSGYSFYDQPGATATQFNAINDSGLIVGRFIVGGLGQGLIWDAGSARAFNVTGARQTHLFAVNNKNIVAGYWQDLSLNWFGFTANQDGSNVVSVRYPDGSNTRLYGVNDDNQIAGTYGGVNGFQRGFTASAAPEPASLALCLLALPLAIRPRRLMRFVIAI
jgi:hypothetical protein